ncbi:MAG: low molecular weight protein-tyrosine-phosphatase [Gammaproteobacteria bacterium]
MKRVLFVCTGNLCRSPLAQGLLEAALAARGLANDVQVDSAGTHAVVGEPPAPFAIEVARDYGSDISGQRARQLQPEDFERFDRIVALDLGHLDQLRFLRPEDARAKVTLLLAGMAAAGDAEVPDPYGRERDEFEFAARLIDVGVKRLLEELADS